MPGRPLLSLKVPAPDVATYPAMKDDSDAGASADAADTYLDAADASPFRQFDAWFREALASSPFDPTAMTLATVGPDGRPSARMVLLKSFDEQGFVFFTNYESRKGRELAQTPHAALVLHWPDMARQVRVEGSVTPTPAEESDAYFATRPRGSQLGAWASAQSRVIAGREALEQKLAELTAEYEGRDVPRPPHWGGFRLAPTVIELWQGRADRLHDRLRYRLEGDSRWVKERLSP
jgi:pyridoxamine 5'-phosphate oxidase